MKNIKDYEAVKNMCHPDQKYGCVSFAQHGDDLVILNIFGLLGIERPSYLDLGAHDPVIISNTALLYEKGSRGVNVEANPNLYSNFLTQRPEDTNVNVGVGLRNGDFTFYMYSPTSGRNTFCKEEVKSLEGVLSVKQEISLPMLTLSEIVKMYCGGIYPDILLSDLEGLDYEVVESADFSNSKPKVIVIETRKQDTDKVKSLLQRKGFKIYCRMGENLFFVRDDIFPLLF